MNAHASTLMDVYQQAMVNDPAFKAARAQFYADQENLPIAFATLLPQFDLSGQLQRNYNSDNGDAQILGENDYTNTRRGFTVSLSQAIFNYQAMSSVKGAGFDVKRAVATFNAAQQDLMFRTAEAYFNILLAYADLRYTQAEKKSLQRQLEQSEERFKVGVIAVTDVQESRAKYKRVLADEIQVKNNIENRLEELREITNRLYTSVRTARNVPLLMPNPSNIHRWVDIAIKQNYTLLAQHYASEESQANILVERGARYPVVNGTASFTNNTNTNASGFGKFRSRAGLVGASVDFPFYQGGLISARTRKAARLYQEARANEEKTFRSVIAQTRKSYLGIIAGISKIRAEKEAIKASESALQSIEAAYIAGTRTLTDVLIQQTSLFDTQRNYARSIYGYLLDLLRLKLAAGTISASDINSISGWLIEQVDLREYYTQKSIRNFAHYRDANYHAHERLPKPTLHKFTKHSTHRKHFKR